MKYLLVLFILSSSLLTYADDGTMKIEIAVEGGYSPRRMLATESTYDVLDGMAFTRMKGNVVLFNTIFVGGSFDCSFDVSEDLLGMPFLMNYGFWAGLRWGSFEVGFRHHCYHPVLTGGESISLIKMGGYEEFYIKIETEIGVIP